MTAPLADSPLPMTLFDGATAIALDRSDRGGGLHGIFLVEHDRLQWVVKCYGREQRPITRLFSRLGGVLSGRSATDAQTRCLTEEKALHIWREHGFDVFQPPAAQPPVAIDLPHLLMAYVDGRTLKTYFADPHIDKAAKLAVFERFIPPWGRRHLLAQKSGNRYLVHKHATFQHVYLGGGGRFIFYDFETVYTRPHSLPGVIAREIAGYLRSLLGVVAPDDFKDYLAVLLRNYPQPEFLAYPYQYFFRHPNLFLRVLYFFDRQLPRNRRQKSKYNLALRLEDYMRTFLSPA